MKHKSLQSLANELHQKICYECSHDCSFEMMLISYFKRAINIEMNKNDSTERKRYEELLKENENIIWNLAGCSTYALGYGLDEGHDKASERAALVDVRNLALKYRTLKAVADRMAEALQDCIQLIRPIDSFSASTTLEIADEALTEYKEVVK